MKWIEIDQENLQPGTAMVFCTSYEH